MAGVLKEEGFINLDAAGMSLTDKAQEILTDAREFSRAMGGLTALETALSQLLPVHKVFIAAGDADQEDHVLADVARMAAHRVRSALQNGNTLAVTGGTTISLVAKYIPMGSPLNVMVVPARGGMGRTVETQANTLAAEIARKIGGHHRLMHVPDRMEAAALQEMLKLAEIREAVELLQRADVILHGIGRADDMGRERRLSVSTMKKLQEEGAVAESFGTYFDKAGKCLYADSSVGVDLGALSPTCQMIAVAAGKRKAEAIIAVMRHHPHAMLVTDEGAAKEMKRILQQT